MDAEALRAQFPVLEEVAYLNSGTDGPLAAPAVESARAELAEQAATGRVHAHFERRFELQDRLRGAYARLVGAPVEEIALTTSTTDGIGRVLAGLGLGEGDEIVTSDQEHPGLLGPLLAARRRGVTVREVPFAHVPEAVGAGHDARRALARELGRRRGRPRRAAGPRRPGDPRRRPGRRRGPRRPARARLRRLRGLGPEVALRRGRHRLPLARPRVRRAGRAGQRRLHVVRRRLRRARGRLPRHDRPLRHALAAARGGRAVARRDRAAREPRLGRGPGARRRARAPARRRAARARPDRDAARRDHAGELGGPVRRGGPRPARRGPASSSATCPAARCCAPRSAPGTTSPTWSGCSTASPRRAPAQVQVGTGAS